MRDISQLLFADLKSDEEKSAFFLSGRAYETGIVASTIQNELAMAYHRIVELKKELAEAQRDAERYQWETFARAAGWVPPKRQDDAPLDFDGDFEEDLWDERDE